MSDKLKTWGILTGIIILFIFIALNLSTDIEAQKKACNEKCHKIIHISAVEAAGSAAALSQFPGADNVALALLIGKMVIDLSNVYDIPLSGTAIEIGKSILKQHAFIIATRFASQWLIGWIPFLGNGTNAATISALVEYIGWDVAGNFERQKFKDT